MSQIFASSTGGSSPAGTFVWEVKATGEPLKAGFGFISTSATDTTFPLPTTADVGDVFELSQGAAGLLTISQAAGQSIRFAQISTTSGATGSIKTQTIGDSVKLVCSVANAEFVSVTGAIGNWLIT